MRVLFVFVVVLLAVAGLLPETAHGRSVTVLVQVTTGDPDYKPVSGAEVEIVDRDGNPLGTGVTDAKGVFKIQIELPEGVEDAVIGVDRGAGGGNGYTSVDLQAHGVDVLIYTRTNPNDGSALPVLIRRAIAKCDKAEYDRWVAELDRLIAQLEQDLAAQQVAADNFARANNLRVTDLKGARKDFDRAAKAQAKIEDASLRNPAMLGALDAYIELLEDLEQTRSDLEAARKARQEVPPFPKDCKKTDEVGLVPGNCPDGAGGGLLAGAINDVFGTDLGAACPDGSRRRDTDRPRRGGKDRHHDRHN